jgi:hypothetical protein
MMIGERNLIFTARHLEVEMSMIIINLHYYSFFIGMYIEFKISLNSFISFMHLFSGS